MTWGDYVGIVLGLGALAAMLIFSPKARWIVKETFRHPFTESKWEDE